MLGLVMAVVALLPLQDARADFLAETFSLSIDAQERLVLSGGSVKTPILITAPAVSQPVTIGSHPYTVSYGKDMDGHLSAVIAPASPKAASLVFDIAGKRVEMDNKSVTTIVFSDDKKGATIHPGYIGNVKVNGQKVDSAVAKIKNSSVEPLANANGQPPVKQTAYTEQPNPDIDVVANGAAPDASASTVTDAQGGTRKIYKGRPVSPDELGTGETTFKPFKGFTTETAAKESRLRIPNFPLLIGGLGRSTLARDGALTQGAERYILLKDKEPKLQQEVIVEDPGAFIVPLNDYYTSENAVVISPASFTGQEFSEVWLQHTAFWAEPVTPPDASKRPSIAANEVKMFEVRGNVLVTPPNSANAVAATEGMPIQSGSKIQTQSNGSAAVLFGGVSSVRFSPNSRALVRHSFDGSARDVTVNLEYGNVFSKVGKRQGETQALKVVTPGGTAKAVGTELATQWRNNVLGVFTASGEVETFDAGGNLVGRTSSDGRGMVGMLTIPAMSVREQKMLLNKILIDQQPFNMKINNILEARAADKPISAQEAAYLNNSPQIYYAVLARRSSVQNVSTAPLLQSINALGTINVATQPDPTTPF
jgi:hypothetical protein